MSWPRVDMLKSSVGLVPAFAFAALLTFELGVGSGSGAHDLSQDPFPLIYVALMVLFTFGAGLGAVAALFHPEGNLAASLTSAGLATVATAMLGENQATLDAAVFFTLLSIGHATYAFGVTHLLMITTQMPRRLANRTAVGTASAVGATAFFGYLAHHWTPYEEMALILTFVRDGLLATVPPLIMLASSIADATDRSPRSLWQAFKALLPASGNEDQDHAIFALTLCGLTASLLLQVALRVYQADDEVLAVLGASSLGWLGCSRRVIEDLRQAAVERQQGRLSASLAPLPAQRFLRRYISDQEQRTATMGFRTTSFVIDHDPSGELHANMPATVLQIRSEEIQRCVSEILGSMCIHTHSASHRVIGAIDPEGSLRPCVDTLKMFAGLYLDAGPLVERRIKGLISLLPIIDPGLNQLLRKRPVLAMIQRNQWFFHFDFTWLDQHVVPTSKVLRYDVRVNTLSSSSRQAILRYVEKTGSVGNFIWLGAEARERLLQEAPTLLPIVEPCPVNLGDDERTGEVLMFMIRFEQLIPRLQRYFDLDSMRRALMDFEPSPDSTRTHLVLNMHLKNAKSQDDLLDLLKHVAAVRWRGFLEKDNALQLILTAYERILAGLPPGTDLAQAKDDKSKAIHQRLLAAVRAVGYPSQALHDAQINKMALRDLAKLKEVASRPSNRRFAEAWLVMATTDYRRYAPDERRDLLRFLRSVPQSTKLAGLRLAQSKSVDTVAALARATQPDEEAELRGTMEAIHHWFLARNVDPDIYCLLLDTHNFMTKQLRLNLKLPDAARARYPHYVASQSQRLGEHHPQLAALQYRWLEAAQPPVGPVGTRAAAS